MRLRNECETTVRDMMHHKMNRALSSVGVGILCGVIGACAGGDTPARNSALVEFLSDEYGSGTVGAVGGRAGNSGTGGNNSSGSGGRSGSGGTGGNNSAGDGGSASGDGGDGGSDVGGGGDGGSAGGGGGDCDGFAILQDKCGTSSCHGTGAAATDFAASESAAAMWVDEPAATGCASTGTPIYDPGDPSESLVIIKLAPSPPCGLQMPITGPGTVTPDEIACIEEFIGGL